MAVARWVVDPVEGDERQASKHENNSHNQEDGRLERKETRGGFSVCRSTTGVMFVEERHRRLSCQLP